jgi:hypothetical protein
MNIEKIETIVSNLEDALILMTAGSGEVSVNVEGMQITYRSLTEITDALTRFEGMLRAAEMPRDMRLFS